jgi:tetratricopeptide (TPR) repeat protein
LALNAAAEVAIVPALLIVFSGHSEASDLSAIAKVHEDSPHVIPRAARNRAGLFAALSMAWGGFALLAGCLVLAAGCSSFSAQGHNAEGVRLYQQARYSEALREFQQANYIDPQNADGYYNLAATYHRLGVGENSAAQMRQAEDLYHQCLNRDPNHREGYRGLAVLLAQQNRSEEAQRILQGWSDQQPRAADPKIELARLHEELGHTNDAKERLTEAVAVEPYSARAWAALGRLREGHGEAAQALVDYQQSLACDQNQPDVSQRVAALAPTVGVVATATVPASPVSVPVASTVSAPLAPPPTTVTAPVRTVNVPAVSPARF